MRLLTSEHDLLIRIFEQEVNESKEFKSIFKRVMNYRGQNLRFTAEQKNELIYILELHSITQDENKLETIQNLLLKLGCEL